MNKRDDFSAKTKDILAKRVGYLCSNPECRKPTVGPNEDPQKATNLGIAAHITAASPGGARYDETLTTQQRRNIDNGIWLCSNCSILIDRNETKFSVGELNIWKENTESFIEQQLLSSNAKNATTGIPILEADLIWNTRSRSPQGYSPKNKPVIEVGIDSPIIFWELKWNYFFTIYNNSSFNAYNIRVEVEGDTKFSSMTELSKVNSLPSLKNIDLETKYNEWIEDTHKVADEILSQNIPEKLNGLKINLYYLDESRTIEVKTEVSIVNGEVVNQISKKHL